MDLTKFSPRELKNLLENNAKHGKHQTVVDVLREMKARGIATKKEYRYLEWNQESVQSALAPFKAVAEQIQGNLRTPYTEAGGLKIGKPKDDPDAFWVNTYSAMKSSDCNAVFVCYIKQPGNEPSFELSLNNDVVGVFTADELESALEKWKAIAASPPFA